MGIVHSGLLAVALVASPSFVEVAPEDPQPVQKVITLDVELKDPFRAYALGLVPFGSEAACNYVGTSRLTWSPPFALKDASTWQFVGDLAFVGGYYLLNTLARSQSSPATADAMRYGAWVSLAMLPLVHYWAYGPYWGKQAADFNREQLERAGFKDQANWR